MPYIGTTPTKVVSRQSANVYRYTATAGQSVFTGADLDNNVLACNPADMIVHMNGLRLESTDYTATSASVTLTTAATAGDEVTVTSFVTFEVADTYTKTAADDRYVNTTGDTMTGVLGIYTAASDPVGSQGHIYFNTDKKALRVHDGTRWMSVRENIYPTQFSGLDAWWDFSGTFSTVSSGNSSVTDASGNGHTLTETGTCPTTAFPNGRNGVRVGVGASNANYFTASGYIPVAGAYARTLFIVISNQIDISGLQHLMHYGNNAGMEAFGIAWYVSNYQQHLWGAAGATLGSYNLGVSGADGVRVIFSSYDGSTGYMRVYDSSSEEASQSSTSYTPNTGYTYPLSIGLRVSGSEGGDFVVGECGVYTRALSTYEMDKIAQGLLDRWGNG